jgi:hypothetical protein
MASALRQPLRINQQSLPHFLRWFKPISCVIASIEDPQVIEKIPKRLGLDRAAYEGSLDLHEAIRLTRSQGSPQY